MLKSIALSLLGVLILLAGCSTPDGSVEPAAAGESADTPSGASTAEAPSPAVEPLPEIDIEPLRSAVDAAPDDPGARRSLAIALFQSRRRDEAVEQFEKALELERTPRGLLDLALAYASVSRLDEAENLYTELLERTPGDPIALHNMGNLAYKRGDLERAITLYGKAIESRPDYLLAHSHLAEAMLKAGMFREAYRMYEKILGLEPATGEELQAFDDALYQMAALDMKMGAYERAARMLEELLQASPKHPSGHYAYGQALMYAGQTEAAQREFEIHLRILDEIEPRAPVATSERP